MYDAFHPGEEWLDTGGSPIHIHGGSVIRVGDAWYWYGEDKSNSRPGSGIWHSGVRAYRSMDLYNWEDQGHILPARPDTPGHPLHPATMMDRPHIVYNATTERYVCWMKIMGDDGSQKSWVFTATDFLGPYELAHEGFRPLGMDAGDFDLVVDPATGAAHYLFDKVHTELICADLTDDYLDVTGTFSSHFPHPHPPAVREAPAHFAHDGRHYLITSGTSWYFPNRSEVAVADDLHGPWTILGNPHPDDASDTSFHSQVSSVLTLDDGTHIALADRWLPEVSDELIRRSWDATAAQFTGGERDPEIDRFVHESDPDTSRARHVWLPITFRNGIPVIEWHDEWRLGAG